MKILHLASGDLWAGAEVQLYHLLSEMTRSSSAEIMVVLFNHGKLEQELCKNNINVIVLNERECSTFTIIKKLYAITREFGANVIHTHRYKENIIGSIVAKFAGAKSIRTAHGLTELSELSDSKYSPIPFIINSIDRMVGVMLQQKIVAVSEAMRQKLSTIYPDGKIVAINNGIDLNYLEDRSKEKCRLDIEPEKFNIAFVGRFVPVKRTDLLCAIAREVLLSESADRIQFHFFGDGPLKKEAEEKVNRYGMSSRIIFHGFVDNVAPCLKKMNLLMFTSEHEGLPMTLLEAMSLGIPVISRNLPSIKQVLCEGGCGIFPEPETINKYASCILMLSMDESKLINIAEMAKQEVRERYNIKNNVESYLQAYSDIL